MGRVNTIARMLGTSSALALAEAAGPSATGKLRLPKSPVKVKTLCLVPRG